MNDFSDDRNRQLRKSVYAVLIAACLGGVMGRIMAVDSIDKRALERDRAQAVFGDYGSMEDYLDWKRKDLERRGYRDEALDDELENVRRLKLQQLDEARLSRPFLSANDRSRWCTVRALVEPEMQVPGKPFAIDKVIAEPGWDTIDMVKHDGHLYSSKPPLFPTLMAGEYWLIHRATGWTLGEEPYLVGRLMLVSINVLPLLIYFWLLALLAERFGTTDWGRLFVMAAAAFGTFLTTFAVVINNHLPAAVCAAAALYATVRIWFDGERRVRYFLVAGLAAAFCAANELPAASLFAAMSLVLMWKAPRQTLVAYVPAVLLVLVGFFGTNLIAHHDLRPPYMHRSESDPADNWYDYEYEVDGRTIQSYWRNRVGVDRGEPSQGAYALHVLVGHHGIFSLTPVWLLSVLGLGIWLTRGARGEGSGFRVQGSGFRVQGSGDGGEDEESSPPAASGGNGAGIFGARTGVQRVQLALLIAALSLVCIVFYVTRPQDDRNYGGLTSGFRWAFWFAPLWLTAMLPAADWMARRKWTRAVGLLLLAFSALSASYPTWNPWTHPWLVDFLQWLGWIRM